MPTLGFQLAPSAGIGGAALVAYEGVPFLGAQTKVVPSADTAIDPEPVLPDGAPAKGVQVLPPSVEKAPFWPLDPELVPTRATTSGAASAKSRLWVLPKIGSPNIPSGGETARSSWRNPPMSPTPESKGAPAGGLARSSTTVSSSPPSWKVQLVGAPLSAMVTSALDQRPCPVMKSACDESKGSISTSPIQPIAGKPVVCQ